MNQLTQTDSFFVTRADCAILVERLRISRKLTQMWNSLARFARWNNLQRFWENRVTRWINFVKMIHLAKPNSDFESVQNGTDAEDESCWVMLTHVGVWWFMMIYDVARRSMFCQLRVLGRVPLRLINVWQSFGKDCQSCADCTTWKIWISRIILCRIEANWRTAPLVFLIFYNLVTWWRCDSLWHVAQIRSMRGKHAPSGADCTTFDKRVTTWVTLDMLMLVRGLIGEKWHTFEKRAQIGTIWGVRA